MAVTAFMYGAAVGKLANKEIDFDSDTFKIMLLDNTHTPAQDTHDYLDDVVADEVSGTGYTAGGATLATVTWTYNATTNTWTLDADNVEWAASTLTARYAVIYDNTPATNATKPLLVLIDFGEDRSTTAGPFQINFAAAGILTAVVAAAA